MEEEQIVSTEEVAQETTVVAEEVRDETTGEVAEPPKPKKSAQERINEFRRKLGDKEREAEYWRAKALEKEPPKEAPAAPSTRPKISDFDTTEEYEDALFAWRDRQRESELQKVRAQQDTESAWSSFNERAEKARAEYEDFDEVIETPPLTDYMRNALLRSEDGPHVAYYLGNHHAESKRICALPAELQLVELGKIATKIELARATPRTTKAPPPPNPVGMGGGKTDKDPSKMTDDEWYAWKKEQQKKEIEDRLKSRGRI